MCWILHLIQRTGECPRRMRSRGFNFDARVETESGNVGEEVDELTGWSGVLSGL